ncbi:MAG: hypothetical protein ACK42L_05800, partial [Thermoanaerobaculum sp.]
MNAVCQVPAWILTLVTLVGHVAIALAGQVPLRQKPPDGLAIHFAPVLGGDFPTVRVSDPELAACIVLAGGILPKNEGAVQPPQQTAFTSALQRLLLAVQGELPENLRVFYGFFPQPTATAAAFGDTVLLLLPESTPTTAVDAARTVASAWLLAQKTPAAPEAGVGELVLRVAESLAWLGSLALASTPPELLPIGEWVEPKAVAPALEGFL